jgi:hypothetical protein
MPLEHSAVNYLTAVIKTFERPECLRKLLISLRSYYPSIPVIVVDDSRRPLPDRDFDANVRYIHTEFDIGLSEGRNRGVELVKTEHVLLLDDDIVFVDQTRLDRLQSTLMRGDFDIVGSQTIEREKSRGQFCGIFEFVEDDLIMRMGQNRGAPLNKPIYDFCPNVFVARTDFLRANPWAPQLKLREHWEFFYRIYQKRPGSVTVREDVQVHHHPVSPAGYDHYRRRSKDFLSVGLAMHGLRDLKTSRDKNK